ncbi:hypothetical protein PMZ80_002845 [Knufia obscura]|uniref:ribonuclease Z n=1 Tax=Knufia obscura TaxID=1635080 RepID=A0ABR0RYI7_9EURO|nr:hypothetical protein PMZ80_002845 [Knufia obscura]
MSPTSDIQNPVDRHKFYFQFVTTPTADTPGTTVLLHFDNKRYLFGRVAEGTQRACVERGVSLKKARNIFLTGETKWEQNSGLLGMILTMADVAGDDTAEEKKTLGDIVIHGGPKIWHSIACARRFIFRTGMPLNVREADPKAWKLSQQPDYVDANILLWALPVERKMRRGSGDAMPNGRSASPSTIQREQNLRQKTVHDMFDSDWRKDRLTEAVFRDIKLPAMIWKRDPSTKDLQSTFCTKMEDAPYIDPDEKVLVRMPWPSALVTELPPADNLPTSVSMSYFVKGRPQRGVFLPKKAKELGVKPGPDFGKLSSGQSVTLEDGRVIKSEDVLDAQLPGYGVAVLDAQDVHYLPDLLQKLNNMQDAEILVNVHAFIWILGPGVLHSHGFSEFRASFPSVKHIISSVDDSPNYLAMDSFAASAARLAQIRPNVFTIPKHNNDTSGKDFYGDDLIQAQRALLLQAAPKFELSTKDIPEYVNIDAKVAEMSDETRSLISALETSGPSAEEFKDISITTLGTGSAQPSKYRNVSANLLHIPSIGYFILDAGENTIGQLRRLYQPDELEEILCNLHMIWISHLHADHHLGTLSLMVAHREATRKRAEAGNPVSHKLYLVSETNMTDYLEDYKSVESTDAVMLRVLQSQITDVNYQPVRLKDTTLPITRLDTVRVSHCQRAQAISITFSNGFKVSYSGDCRPSAAFAEIGKDSDVLIHEATFDDGMEGDAIAKRHSTIGEALGVASAMKAKNVILTHFSQRYQKLPTLTDVKPPNRLNFEEGGDANDPPGPIEDPALTENAVLTGDDLKQMDQAAHGAARVQSTSLPPALKHQTSLQEAAEQMSICIAFDLMRVTIPQIKDMYKYYPAIESMFEHEQFKSDERRGELRAANEALISARNKKGQDKVKAGEQKKKDKNQGGKSVSGTQTSVSDGVEE